jgi:hypothetical protein
MPPTVPPAYASSAGISPEVGKISRILVLWLKPIERPTEEAIPSSARLVRLVRILVHKLNNIIMCIFLKIACRFACMHRKISWWKKRPNKKFY